MTEWIAVVLVASIAGLAVWLLLQARWHADTESAALRQEMQALLAAQTQSFIAQLGHLSSSVTTQLGQLTDRVHTGMASVGQLATSAHKNVSDELQKSTEMLLTLSQKLGEMQQAGHELSDAAKQIESVLGGAKTRGTLGEIALDRILADTLGPAPGIYEMQYRFATGEAVDAVVRLRDKLLPIDSKFPLDDYRRLLDTGEDARKGFSQAVRFHADSIAKKYILPGEGTLDIALMFVPSEGVYYELLRSEDTKGTPLDEYCRGKCVVPVSPNTLFAYLRIVALGLRGMQIEEHATRLLSSLTGLQQQIRNFSDIYEKLGTHLHNARQSYEDGDRKLDRARDALEELAQGAPADKVLESTD